MLQHNLLLSLCSLVFSDKSFSQLHIFLVHRCLKNKVQNFMNDKATQNFGLSSSLHWQCAFAKISTLMQNIQKINGFLWLVKEMRTRSSWAMMQDFLHCCDFNQAKLFPHHKHQLLFGCLSTGTLNPEDFSRTR